MARAGRTSKTGSITALASYRPQPFVAAVRSVGDKTIIELRGECDASSLNELNTAFSHALGRSPRSVIVDLRRATFVDSLTLGTFTAAAKRVRAGGGSFKVVGVKNTEVRRAFEITGLDKYLLADAPT